MQVEGGQYPSIFNWEARLKVAAEKAQVEAEAATATTSQTEQDGETQAENVVNGDKEAGEEGGEGSRPPSSGLSSLGGRSIADEMDLS